MRCGGRCAIGFEPFEREREVRAALRGCERVDLVDDDELHRPQRLARLRREHEVERLGRGDEDVGRECAAAPGGRGSRCRRCAAPTRGLVERTPSRSAASAIPRSGDAQVLLDVDGERAQRRDVEHAAALALRRHRLAADAVDRPEERGERLARAGRRQDQGVVAGRDRGPAAGLGRGGRGERRVEPGLDRRRELLDEPRRSRYPAP